MSDLTTHDVLCAAKAHLMGHGWARSFGDVGGPRCILGALDSAARGHFETGGPGVEAEVLLMDILDVSHLSAWNDAPERTFDEVIALLDEAILATAPTPVEPKVAA